jgi:hypothetical protein
MNNYIVTNFGFIKNILFNKESLTTEIEYTDKLRYAKPFNSKTAKELMVKHDIIGFMYNPYAEEPVRNMYEVKRKYNNSFEEKNGIQEWVVVRAIMINESDANFLQSRKLKSRDLMTFEQATAKAIELNTVMLEELNEIIKIQLHDALQQSINNKEE